MTNPSIETTCPATPLAARAAVQPVIPGPLREPLRGLSLFRRFRQLRQTYSADVFEHLLEEQKIGRFRFLILNDPESIRHVLVDNAKSYGKSPFLRRLLEPALGQGLVTSDGEIWNRHRRLMAPPFAHRNLYRFAPIIAGTTSQFLSRWDSVGNGAVVDVAEEMSKLTLSSIARTMFGQDDEHVLRDITKIVAKYQEVVGFGIADLLGLPNWVPRLSSIRGRYVVRHLDEVVDQLIRQDHGSTELLIDLLIGGIDKDGGRLNRQEIRDEIVTILTVGHETTAQALTWTWYLLSEHPEVEDKLMEELNAVLGGRDPIYEDLDRLTYTKAIVQESMRLFPPAPTFSRLCLSDDVILGRRIPKGTIVMIAPWVLHRHRRFWDHPDNFKPERFHLAHERPRAYLPFGVGPRICIGAGFAMMEAVMILAQIAQRYRLKLVPKHPVVPVARIALRSRYGMKMTLNRR
jgi:cytochrome P450